MFYTIHRCVKLLLVGCILLAGWKIYEEREIFEPGWVWLDVWDNGGFKVKPPESIAGKVVAVINRQTFVILPRKSGRLNVRLMGLRDASAELSIDAAERERNRKKALEELVLNRWVHVELHYQNANNIGGVVYTQGTNVNAQMVLLGNASTAKEMVNGFAKEAQYERLWAQRHQPSLK